MSGLMMREEQAAPSDEPALLSSVAPSQPVDEAVSALLTNVSQEAIDFPGYDPEVAFPGEPARFAQTDLDRLLIHVSQIRASDITIQTEEPVYAELAGRFVRLTKRPLTNSEVDAIVNLLYGTNGSSRISQGMDIDQSYTVQARGGPRYRFRVNITGCHSYGTHGTQITIRMISGIPPLLKELRVEPGILSAYRAPEGLVLICGPTGSGKSTLLSAMMREIAADPEAHKKIITYEAPIEYVYDEVPRATTVISQHEIPRHLPSFAAAVRNSLRRAPKIILVGETRDAETVQAALEAAETGHTVYSTAHVESVPGLLYRLTNLFPPAERGSKMFEIIEALRLVVVQRLVRTRDGRGRVALREFLYFDQAIRDELRHAQTLREAVAKVAQFVDERGQPMIVAARHMYQQGVIGERELEKFELNARPIIEDESQPQGVPLQ